MRPKAQKFIHATGNEAGFGIQTLAYRAQHPRIRIQESASRTGHPYFGIQTSASPRFPRQLHRNGPALEPKVFLHDLRLLLAPSCYKLPMDILESALQYTYRYVDDCLDYRVGLKYIPMWFSWIMFENDVWLNQP